MKGLERLGLAALHRIEPERAHALSLMALRLGLVPLPGEITSRRLATEIAGLPLPNPLGLAAGYDKNAVAVAPLLRAGFGFVELGAATPRPQPGNPRPRLFRLKDQRAVINRFGFNNDGAEAIAARLARRPGRGVVGLNLGANKDSEDRSGDYARVLERCGRHVDFVTINVSSPNTGGLRDLQEATALAPLIGRVMAARESAGLSCRIFLKIAPDLSDDAVKSIADIALAEGIDALIATNTTTAREGLGGPHAQEPGGLSGVPLFAPSTRVLALLARHLDGALPLIGVGGIDSAETAYAKIRAGAGALQLYTAMVYGGIGLVGEILSGLEELLKRDGFGNVAEAVGIDKENWK